MSSLTKAETFFKTVKLTTDDNLFVGVDVHKGSVNVTILYIALSGRLILFDFASQGIALGYIINGLSGR